MDAPRITGAASPSPRPGGPRQGGDRWRPSWQRVAALVSAGTLLVVFSGCSSDPQESAVTVAQASVSAKEKALADAESAATAAAAAFCAASSTYITALDRYGDVLNQTAPTVGDVKDAGADLTKPRDRDGGRRRRPQSAPRRPWPRQSRTSPTRRWPWPPPRLPPPARPRRRPTPARSPSAAPSRSPRHGHPGAAG